jgi:Gpi18-like mannosyltransferase
MIEFLKTFLCHCYKYFIKRRGNTVSISSTKREIIILAVLLAVSFLVRVLLFPLKGYPIDTNDFLAWFGTAAAHGIRPFYTVTWSDYPPFNVYIFWFFGTIANAVSTHGISAVNIVKLAPNLFDLGTALLIYFFVRKQASFKLALAAMALYAFNPAVIYNAAVWGQYDAVYTFFLILSLMLALKAKPELSAATLAIALLTKPQAIALAPLIAFLIYKKSGLKRMLFSVLAFALTIFLIILPFDWNGQPLTSLSQIYFGGFGQYSVTSVNAFNIWGLYGLWVPDGNFFIVGWALFGAFAVFTLYFLHKRFNTSNEFLAVFAAFMFFFAFFMLPTRIHERYLFPAISVLALMFPFIKKARPLYVALTTTLFINEAYVLYWLNASYPNAAPNLTGDPVVLAVSAINLLMLVYASILMWDELKGRRVLKGEPVQLSQSQEAGGQNEPWVANQ